jgi:hydrogenase nickel incorporation protein HypA/HybF
MSIAMGIIEIVEEECIKANAISVSEIELDLGTVSGIMIEALEFALSVAVPDTILQNAIIKINKIEAKAQCEECHNVYLCESLLDPCPACQSFRNIILSGKELKIKSLLVD